MHGVPRLRAVRSSKSDTEKQMKVIERGRLARRPSPFGNTFQVVIHMYFNVHLSSQSCLASESVVVALLAGGIIVRSIQGMSIVYAVSSA